MNGHYTGGFYGTDSGPMCWRCKSTIWAYHVERHVMAKCCGCHAVEGPINYHHGEWHCVPDTARDLRIMHTAFSEGGTS